MSPIVKQKYPIKLRGTAMEEFKIFEATLFNLSPCAAQWYRGSAHRARGLNDQYKPADERLFSTPPSLRATSPIWLAPHRGGVLNVFDSETEIPHKATGHGNGGV